jgi:transposase-like protein
MHMVVPHVVCNFVSFQTKKCASCAYNFIEETWKSFEKPKVSVKQTVNHW